MRRRRESPLSRRAVAFRSLHALIAVGELVCLGHVWICAVTRRRDALFRGAVAVLLAEGGGLIVGRGNCPLGPLQDRLGDPVPLFQLVLPPRAAKAAVPVLAGVAVGGMALAAARPPSPEHTAA